MKIELSQPEIEHAIIAQMESLISIKEGKHMTCSFTTTRAPFSIIAEINIVEDDQPEKPQERSFPSSPIIEPEEEENPAEEPVGSNSVRSLFGNLN